MPGGILQSLATHSAQLMARATPVCDSQVCQTTAASILNDMDLNVDPCSDFYQYTCKAILNIIFWDGIIIAFVRWWMGQEPYYSSFSSRLVL
jgi:hypothetical protein